MTTHGGNIHKFRREQGVDQTELIDFSANINPLGPPPNMRSIVSRSLVDVEHYPDPDYFELKQSIALAYNVLPETIIVGNGTTEILYHFFNIIKPKRVLIPVPSYIDYFKVVELSQIEIKKIFLQEHSNFNLDIKQIDNELCVDDAIIIGSPNNPTGQTVSVEDIAFLAEKNPKSLFIIDEAFLDFVIDGISVGGKYDNVITLNSLTKFYAIPGLRLGFGVLPKRYAESISRTLPPWSVNSIANAVGVSFLQDITYQKKSRITINTIKNKFYSALISIKDLTVFPSEANFFLVKTKGSEVLSKLYEFLLARGLVIRRCDNYYGLDDTYFRLAVRTEKQNNLLMSCLNEFFKPNKKVQKKNNQKSLMIQGTSSNAGKSILTAALCRILLQDGIRVAPFKAQNMSLNSFVTNDNLEMGRAQVVQAQAAKIDPDIRMNPILLKPNSDTGSQVVVEGKAIGNMNIYEYNKYKKQGWEIVKKNFDNLSSDFDAVILEGAGSPGEVNLKHDDIVNMRMARYSDSPVLLVGDIDRGGIYASFIGTMEVLEEWERSLVAGFVVNKFRGEADLLKSAHTFVRNHTGREVLGVIPYVSNLSIPDEDSVSFKSGYLQNDKPISDYIDIVVISLPHISNFTDVEPFYNEPDVHLRVVDRVEKLGNPDVIILPGSKNVFSDLRFIKDSGFSHAINKHVEMGSELIGICGGYIMLGKTISDPYQIESNTSECLALGYLQLDTVLAEGKSLVKKRGKHELSGEVVEGYEIHHGFTSGNGAGLFSFDDNSFCGCGNENNSIWGVYLHGLFDEDNFRRWFIDQARKRKNLEIKGEILAPYDLEKSFDKLADCVRNSIDVDKIHQLLGL